ncbi:hypothetical protein C1646_764833 [Rhizophagus diaphanus]|nr:hypothetical protein C1646_764833 [Rhizophagus diaphanus] [Rhizophagus sp. MUCL 43196]
MYTTKCHYCTQTWSRGRPEILKSHLALHCKEVPLAIKSEYMEMLAIGSTSTNRKQKLDTDSSAAEIDADKKDRIDQALIQYFVCCGIPFSTINHPYFIDFVQKTAIVLKKIKEELKYEEDLTLGRSIYAFIIITPGKRQYIHTLKDTLVDSHARSFNATEIENVLTTIGPKKFAAVVSDAESAMQMARRLISENSNLSEDKLETALREVTTAMINNDDLFTDDDNEEKNDDVIKIISDNGDHYHNSELMAIVSYWYDWYRVEVHGWIFLELGEAKTTVDSYHTTSTSQDIERAIEELSGTSVAQIKLNRNKNNENMVLEKLCNTNYKNTKTIPGISK